MEEQYQFTITDKPVKIVQSENGTTYTLLINRAIDDANTFENLVIKYENDGSINATIINYQPFYPLNTMNYFTGTAFNGLQSVTPIVYNDALVSTTGKISSDCYSVCTILCHDLTESGPYSVPHPPGSSCTGNNVTIDCVVTCWGDNIGGEDAGNDIGTADNTSGGGTDSSNNSGSVSTPPNNCGNCNNPIETAPVLELGEEEETLPKKACEELNKMINKPIGNATPPKTVLTNLNDLKSNVTTNKERMYIMSPTLDSFGNINHNLYNENYAESAENQDYVGSDFGGIIIDIMVHTHWNTAKHLSIFSLDDIYDIYKKIASGQISLENQNYFTTMVITAHGTQYALKFSNIHDFVAWGNNYFLGWDVAMSNPNQASPFKEAKEDKFYDDTGIKLGNTPEIKATNELGWASFIETNDLGLELYRVNDTFTQFTKLSTTLMGGLKETPCTN